MKNSVMLYHEYLKNLTVCPFCDCSDRIIAREPHAFLTYARAPYHPDHLLIVPVRHIEHLSDISVAEREDIDKLIDRAIMLEKRLGYANYSVLVRDGSDIGKSIPHLHYHVIPQIRIGDLDHAGNPRQVLSEEELSAAVSRVKNAMEQ